MNFLSSIFFSLIPLISIPLIIHLLNKRNIITIDFSSIRFLKALETESIRRLQFLQILLMILRTLIILLIILMMTRPVIGGLFSYWNTDDDSLISVILIDDSFSMYGKNDDIDRHTQIFSIYNEILNNISDNSEIYISTLSKGKLYSGIKAKLPEIDKIFEITYTSPEISVSLAEIEAKYADEYSKKELYYITDGQKKHLTSANPFKAYFEDWNIFTLIIPQLEENLSIVDLEIDNVILLPNSPLTIGVTIMNNGSTDIENKLIQLFINDISVAQQLVNVKVHSANAYEFITAVPTTGDYACYFKIEDDDRATDNQFYFKITIPEKLKIGSITLRSDLYMSHLFSSINFKNTIIENTNYLPGNVQLAISDGNQILIQNGYHSLSSMGVELLEYVGNGGHLIIFPDDLDSTTTELDIFEPQYLNREREILSKDKYQIAYSNSSNTNPLFISKTYKENPIKLFRYFQLPQIEKSVLVTDNGYSIYSRHYEGDGIVDIFSISPSLTWSNFPIRGYFIPFFHEIFYNQFNQTDKLYFQIGDRWMPYKEKQSGYEKIKYYSPINLDFDIDMNSAEIFYQKIPGIHQIRTTADSIISFIAMNVPTAEFDSEIANDSELKGYLSENLSIIRMGNIDLKEAIHKSRVGTELWRLILYLISLLIIIEMIISSNAIQKTSS